MHHSVGPKLNSKKRVGIVLLSFSCWPPDFGGEMLMANERLQALAERGHTIVALTRRPTGYSSVELVEGISFRRCPVSGKGWFARAAYLVWTLTKLMTMRFDALHFGVMPARRTPTRALAAWIYGAVAKFRGARTVSVASLSDSGDGPWRVKGKEGIFKGVYYQNIDCLVAVSPVLQKALKCWRPQKNIYIPYGVRNDLFTPLEEKERCQLREEHGIPEDGVVFITIGSAGRRKGTDVLAQAFAALSGKHRNWFLWLVGPMSRAEGCATDECELAEMMAPLRPWSEQVKYFGRQNDRQVLRKLLGAADVFVLPTRREGMPLAPMEAMATGRPVIISHIPGVTDVACVDKRTGVFVPVGDAEALKLAMELLGRDSRYRAELGSQARKRISASFSWDVHISQWEKLYTRGVVPGKD